MKSPHQARPKSTVNSCSCAKGYKPFQQMASGRVTPVNKTVAKIYPGTPKG